MISLQVLKRAVTVVCWLTLFLSSTQSLAAKLYFVHSDHLGTPQKLTDENQQVVWQIESQTPFGVTEVNEDPDRDGKKVEFNLRFPGQYYDKETGLNYNGYRYYDPSHGYTQADPIGILRDYSDPQLQVAIRQGILKPSYGSGLNHLYGYVNQNPLRYFDLYGLETYEGFDDELERRMREAHQEAIDKANQCDTCNNRDNLVKKLNQANYKYDEDLDVCAQVTTFSLFGSMISTNGDKIHLGPSAFNFNKCCDLSSTLAHEANHLLGGNEESSRNLERDCFRCPR